MKKSFTVSIDAEKLAALEMYLGQKNLKLPEELEKFSEELYQKFHAFEPQRQLPSSKPPSPLVFFLISTHFTATLGIPLTSPALEPDSFQCSPRVKPWVFTSDLPCRLRSLYTQ